MWEHPDLSFTTTVFREAAMTTTTFTEHPPVPSLIREQLKDFPELITELEDSLKTVGRRPGMSMAQRTDQFEAAIWCLEAKLGRFETDAAEAARKAEATGQAALIAGAHRKELLTMGCSSSLKRCLGELQSFFVQPD